SAIRGKPDCHPTRRRWRREASGRDPAHSRAKGRASSLERVPARRRPHTVHASWGTMARNHRCTAHLHRALRLSTIRKTGMPTRVSQGSI
ncbi:uncharacterized protein METZ01_LOCUS471800, partial [marine metagenome]